MAKSKKKKKKKKFKIYYTLHRLPRTLPLFTSLFAFCLQHRLDCGEALQSRVHGGTSKPSSSGLRVIFTLATGVTRS